MRAASLALAMLLTGFGLGWLAFAPSTQFKASANVSSSFQKKSLDLALTDGGVYRVRGVIDGDTVVLENGLHLRYNGMNSPESGRWVRDYSPMAKEATAKNIELVEGKRIRIHLASDPVDMHGRIVANVFLVPDAPDQPEIEIRELMLKGGFAKVMDLGITPDERKILKSWQEEAKAAEAGIWGVKNLPKEPEQAKPFCASSSSKTFHKSTCSQARRISPANLHEYATAEEAESVGLRPCAQCLGKK